MATGNKPAGEINHRLKMLGRQVPRSRESNLRKENQVAMLACCREFAPASSIVEAQVVQPGWNGVTPRGMRLSSIAARVSF